MKRCLRMLAVTWVGFSLTCLFAPPAASLVGQQNTCGKNPQRRTVNLKVEEKVVDLGEGLKAQAWTFNGTVPGPTIEACEGDTVKVVMENHGIMAHGMDSHAFRIDAQKFGPIEAGKTLTYEKAVDTPGVYMYHCAAGPVTDQHIKMGMYGVMIVYPRKVTFSPAHELVVTEAGVYGEPDANGLISPSTDRMDANRPYLVVYNGELKHKEVSVKAGELIRVYFVHVGPVSSSFHVIGAILDRVYQSGNPRNVLYGVQTAAVPAGSGAILEFRASEAGKYLLVDHNLVSQVPNGLAIPIVAVPAGEKKSAQKPGRH